MSLISVLDDATSVDSADAHKQLLRLGICRGTSARGFLAVGDGASSRCSVSVTCYRCVPSRHAVSDIVLAEDAAWR